MTYWYLNQGLVVNQCQVQFLGVHEPAAERMAGIGPGSDKKKQQNARIGDRKKFREVQVDAERSQEKKVPSYHVGAPKLSKSQKIGHFRSITL